MKTSVAAVMAEALEFGRGTITPKLNFIGQVTGGGANGPGRVSVKTGYLSSTELRWSVDNRSGSKRSGTCVWQLEADQLYVLDDVAIGSRGSGTFYVKTDCAVAVRLSREEFESERQRRWPMQHQQALEGAEIRKRDEAARIQREAKQAEDRRIELDALAELNAERAAEIAEKGQRVEDGLPQLAGTPKQIAYALNIRRAYAANHPNDAALKRATTSKYWIENHRGALYRR